eukprot:2933448-Amphidinium_carterae.1
MRIPRVPTLPWLLATWTTYATRIAGSAPTWPLVAATFKAGGYRSFDNYLSRAEMEHMQRGHVWTQDLDLMARRRCRACERGLGPPKQSSVLDVDILQIMQTVA